MDFDGGKKKGFINWKYEEKDMQNLRTITAVFAPAISICFLFSVNVIEVKSGNRIPAEQSQDETKTWYSMVKKGIEISVAKR